MIDGKRRKRIARGSGTSVQEVNQVLKQYLQMRTMMKQYGALAAQGRLKGLSKMKDALKGGGLPDRNRDDGMSAERTPAPPKPDGKPRCGWPRSVIALRYHDEEWGVPLRDDRKIFEFLVLDAAQAGLSWEIILRKREGFRAAFDNFDAEKVARYDRAARAETAGRSGNHPQPAEDRIGDRQCPGVPAGAGGVRQLRQLHLAVRGREADA